MLSNLSPLEKTGSEKKKESLGTEKYVKVVDLNKKVGEPKMSFEAEVTIFCMAVISDLLIRQWAKNTCFAVHNVQILFSFVTAKEVSGGKTISAIFFEHVLSRHFAESDSYPRSFPAAF